MQFLRNERIEFSSIESKKIEDHQIESKFLTRGLKRDLKDRVIRK
jgi:hypothetical protein